MLKKLKKGERGLLSWWRSVALLPGFSFSPQHTKFVKGCCVSMGTIIFKGHLTLVCWWCNVIDWLPTGWSAPKVFCTLKAHLNNVLYFVLAGCFESSPLRKENAAPMLTTLHPASFRTLVPKPNEPFNGWIKQTWQMERGTNASDFSC